MYTRKNNIFSILKLFVNSTRMTLKFLGINMGRINAQEHKNLRIAVSSA